VIATAGSDEKCDACLRLGADHAVNYRTQDFVAEVRKLTGERGADVILDMVAGEYIGRELQCVAEDGRIAVIAVQGGAAAQIDAGLLLRKRIALTGSTLRPRSVAYKTLLAQALREQVWPLISKGVVRPVVHQVFDAAQAAQAHALMESSVHVGKIVLRWS
jgi:NADPH2:quinone reductase